MLAAIPFPDISPEIFAIEIGGFTFALRWYALAYIVGILLGWRLAVRALKTARLWPDARAPMKPGELEELMTWVILGIIGGGRLGFVLFYRPGYYLANPIEIPMIWQGGMSFHGGALGVLLAGLWFCRSRGLSPAGVGDVLVLGTPPALFLGRIANFINGELWGRPTELPWGVIFPGERAQDCPAVEGICARHPSQLYEAGLEGLGLGLLLVLLAWRFGALKRPGQMIGVFLAGYGVCRIVVEFFRQADAQYVTPDNPWGHIIQLGEAGLTMGQLLSLPMLAAGGVIVWLARRRG